MRILLILATIILGVFNAPQVFAADEDEPNPQQVFAGIQPRNIGPAVTGGRISDFAFYPGSSSSYLVGTASGGLWKTDNNGTTWSSIFDYQGSYSIGHVEIDPVETSTIWVGTGERNSQRSVAFGDGVYKSTDGGRTWKNMGLENSGHIGAIVVDPRDNDTVYVASAGPLWSAGGDRGVFKTTDGGETWTAILTVDEHTGANEVLVHPNNPSMMLASTHQRRRHIWASVQGGAGSGIYRSRDGGETWDKIGGAIPGVDKGKIGLAYAPSNPNVVYAIVEAQDGQGGIFRSPDFGASWQKVSPYSTGSGQYYNRLFVDPNDENTVYSVDTFMQVSTDGGKTWSTVPTDAKHVDEHALWINPKNSNHLITGNDGGVYETFDKGQTWRHVNNMPIMQLYRVTADNDYPFYNVYGGTQDNSTYGGPSRTPFTNGITNDDWRLVLGGDGFQPQVDPTDPNIVYAQLQYGNLVRWDRQTGERVPLTPQPGADEEAYRWNWNSGFLLSAHDNKRLYFGAGQLFRSDDQGNSWRAISGDLTRNLDRVNMEVMDRVWSIDAVAKNRSTSIWRSIIAIAESPFDENVLAVGTDDGLIQVTRDGGETWEKARFPKDFPEIIYTSDIEISNHDPEVMYAAFSNHKNGDYKPYIMRSEDQGRTWKSIASNLPERTVTHAIVEDPKNPDLLFLGTEWGAYFSQDRGESWHKLSGLPTIAVRDLEIQKREADLILGTFGRGFWIVDNYDPMRTPAARVVEDEAHLFQIKDALLFAEFDRHAYGQKGFAGNSYFVAPNPAYGAAIRYYLRDGYQTLAANRRQEERERQGKGEDNPYPTWEELEAEQAEFGPRVIITIRNSAGQVIRRLSGPTSKGMHTVNWDLRHQPPNPISLMPPSEGLFSGPPQGPYVSPGTYTASISKRIGGETVDLGGEISFVVIAPSRGTFMSKDLAGLEAINLKASDALRRSYSLMAAFSELSNRISHLRAGVIETPEGSSGHLDRLDVADETLRRANKIMTGDTLKATHMELVQGAPAKGVTTRLSIFPWRIWQNLTDVPDNYKRSLEIAIKDLERAEALALQVREAVVALEQELNNTLPYTPGRQIT